MRITVDPERLRALAQQLRAAGDNLGATSQRAGNALGGMDFESRQKVGMDAQASQARAKASALATNADTLAQYLERKADAFEEADRGGAPSGGAAIRNLARNWQNATLTVIPPVSQAQPHLNLGAIGAALPLLAATTVPAMRDAKFILGGLRFGRGVVPAVDRLVVQHLPVSGLTGVSRLEFAGHVAWRNLTRPIRDARGIISGHPTAVQKIGGATLLLTGAINAAVNWQTYKDESMTKVAVGTIVDTALDVGCVVVGSAIGAGVGTFIGGPVGTVIGAKIGGFVGGLAGGFVSQKIKEQPGYKQTIDTLAHGVDAGVAAATRSAHAFADAATRQLQSVQHQAEQLERGLERLINPLLAAPQAV